MNKQRTIAVVTTSRADYSHLYWPMKALQAHPDIELKLIVLGTHLSSEFGHTVDAIEQDGFVIDEKIECLLSSDTDVGMAKTIGLASLSLSDVLGSMRPDILLLIADRYEMLAPATVALALRIPIAHIEGGEISEGAIDDAVRNALTKMSHIHFTPTELSRRRVLAMGEEAWRVHRSGAPSLDHLRHAQLMTREEMERELGVAFDQPVVVATFHPVTLKYDTNIELDAFLGALAQLDGLIVFCYPNADSGARELVHRIEAFCAQQANAHLFVNLGQQRFFSLLAQADLMIGNSSSGIMEAASFGLPTINVGMRQQGRERAGHVIDTPPQQAAIIAAVGKALSPGFRTGLKDIQNPYGDGHASDRMVEVLATVPLGEELLHKVSTLVRV